MAERAYIGDMRQRLGLDEDDSSRDEKIEEMTAEQRLGLIAGWNLGYSDWAGTILRWVRDAGFEVKAPRP